MNEPTFFYIDVMPDQELDFNDEPCEEQREISYDEWRQERIDALHEAIRDIGGGKV